MWELIFAISKVLLFLIILYAVKTYIIDEIVGTSKTINTTTTSTKPVVIPVDTVRQTEKTLIPPKGAINRMLTCKNGFINSINVRTGDRLNNIVVSCSNGETSNSVGDPTDGVARDPIILKNGINKITVERNPTIMNSLVAGQTVVAGKNPYFYPNKVVFDLECKDQNQKIIGLDVLQNGSTLVGIDAIYCKAV